MSSYVFMKVLESAAHRYDRGLHILTCGRITRIYEEIAGHLATPGAILLDVGCGTGEVALACAARGAFVDGIDINGSMLEQAAQKSQARGLDGQIQWHQLGAAEIEDVFPPNRFDGAGFCLSLSEMSPAERSYVLKITHSRLKPGGRLVIADETLPEPLFARWGHWLRRLPFALLTYMLTQTTTHALPAVDELVLASEFVDLESSWPWPGFCFISAIKPNSGFENEN